MHYAMVITEVISPKVVRVDHMNDEDFAKNIMIDENTREYIPVNKMSNYTRVNEDKTNIIPTGIIFKLRKNNRWIRQGNSLWGTGAVHFGHADNYRDPSF